MSDKTDTWKAMPRNNADEIKAADVFYDEHIFPLAAEKFLKQYDDGEKHDLMYVTVGTSWQPIALSVLLHRPQKVIFLCTENVVGKTESALAYMGSNAPVYEINIVDKGDSRKMLEIVAETYKEHRSPNNCCFDITGGTKAMAAAAAMIAAHLGIKIFYIESNYLPVYRHPEPGSESVVTICRPQDV